jgi:hypothetical protein
MAPNPLFYQLLVVALVLICLLIHVGLPDKPLPMPQPSLASNKRRRKRSKEPKPVPGLIRTPLCEACAQRARCPPQSAGRTPSLHPLHRRTSAHRQHPIALLPRSRLRLSWLARPWQHPRQWTSYHLSTPWVSFFTPFARPTHDECGWHHSRYHPAAWPLRMTAEHCSMAFCAPCRIIAGFQHSAHVCDRWLGET